MDDVKKFITSLLTSTPLAVTMQQLGKDYRNTIGEPIPHQKFGFNSLEHFLRSIPDTVRVRGSGPCAEVLPVVSQKSSHVMQLVSNQKKNPPKRRDAYHGKRTVIFAPQKQNSYPPAEQKPRIQYPNNYFQQSNSRPVEKSRPSEMNRPVEMSQPPVYHSTNDYSKEKPVCEKKVEINNHRHTLEKDEKTNHNFHNSARYSYGGQVLKSDKSLNYPKVVDDIQRTNKTNECSELTDEPKCYARSNKNRTHYSDRVTPPVSENLENAIPQTVQNNLRTLIGRYPNGIWCADVPEVYRQMFRREIKYEEFGFRSLIHLCMSLKSIFHYVRPASEDFKLYDRSKPLPISVEKVYTIASYGDGGTTDKEVGAALPNIDWEDVMRYLPPHTFKPGKEIPRNFVPECTSENESIDIHVGEVYDLSKFWIYLDDGRLDSLMDDMQVFYNSHAKDYIIPQQLVREGLYCVQLFFGEYHRALVVDLISLPEEMVRVVFIDYGTVAKVSITGLCFLHEDFAGLPAQAIRCRLANICPPEKGAPWNRETTKAFRQLLMKKDLTAKVIRINWKDQFLEVCLADVTDGNNVYYLNDVLVEKGFAIYPNQEQKKSIIDSLSTPVVSLIHLFPTFMEIEHGLAPSTSEMEVFHDLNVPINFCYPQYFRSDNREEEKILESAVSFHETYCVKETRNNYSIHSKYFVDKEKLKPEPIDMSYFGQLESEMLAYCDHEIPDNKDCPEEQKDDVEYLEGDIAVISKRLEFLKTKTVDELRKDCSLSEDIMRDILSICNDDSGDSQRDDGVSNRELSMITEESGSDTKSPGLDGYSEEGCYTSEGSPTYEISDDCDESHPLGKMTFDDDAAPNSYNLPASDEELEFAETRTEPNNPELVLSNADGIKSPYPNTNPFWQDLTVPDKESDSTDNVLRLNPNNPFLSYLKPKTEDDCSSGTDKSSNSTVYDYAEEIKPPKKWSTNDDRSSDSVSPSHSMSSASIQTASAVEICAISTQTSVEDTGVGLAPQNHSFNPASYNMQMASFAPPNWHMAFNNPNPHYNTRFPNCTYYPPEPRFYAPSYSSVQRFGFGMQSVLPQGTICPPPGFAPRPNFSYGNGNYNVTANGVGAMIPSRPNELFRPPFPAYNCVSGTATISNVSVTSEQDFYDVYNAQLRLRIEHATDNA